MDKRAFLHEVATQLACDERAAAGISFVVLQELRERLTPDEVADVAARLPRDLRRYWCRGDHPHPRPSRGPVVEFLRRIRRLAALPDETEAEHAVIAVFAAVQRLLGSVSGLDGEALDVFDHLPEDLQLLWLRAGVPAPLLTTRSDAHSLNA